MFSLMKTISVIFLSEISREGTNHGETGNDGENGVDGVACWKNFHHDTRRLEACGSRNFRTPSSSRTGSTCKPTRYLPSRSESETSHDLSRQVAEENISFSLRHTAPSDVDLLIIINNNTLNTYGAGEGVCQREGTLQTEQ